MKFIFTLELCLLLLTASNNAIPVGVNKNDTNIEFDNKNIKDDNNTDIEETSVDGGITTDTRGLGSNADNNPKEGTSLTAPTESFINNPQGMRDLFQGDIIMHPLLSRNGVPEEDTWQNGVIPYVFKGNFTDERVAMIMEAMDHYHRFTCVRFVPYENQTDYVNIINESSGCSSFIGRIGGPQVLNIGNDCQLGNTIHELMHTVGFIHEICREDRDEYIEVLFENIYEDAIVDFDIRQGEPFNVPYDYASILHYGEFDFSKNEKRTIRAKKNKRGITLGQRSRLSRGDITKINRMYDDCEPKVKTC